MGEYVLNRVKTTKLDSKSFDLIDKIKNSLSFSRLCVITAVFSMAIFNVSCSDEPAEEPKEETASAPAPAPAPDPVKKEVCLYQHKDYGGWEKCFTENQERFGPLKINDQVSSLKVKGGATAELYEHGKYAGFKRIYTEDTPWVGADNDKFSSLKVK